MAPKPISWRTPPTITPVVAAEKALKSCIEDERLKLLQRAKYSGVQLVHVFDEDNPKGGLTIAFRKCRPNERSTNMVDVAVATCSYSDNFNRKIGTQLALAKFFDEETVALPLSTGHSDEDLNGLIKRKFTALYFEG